MYNMGGNNQYTLWQCCYSAKTEAIDIFGACVMCTGEMTGCVIAVVERRQFLDVSARHHQLESQDEDERHETIFTRAHSKGCDD